jgi:hypothetical protein
LTVAELKDTGLEQCAVIDHAIKTMSEGGEVKVNIPPHQPGRRPAAQHSSCPGKLAAGLEAPQPRMMAAVLNHAAIASNRLSR